MALNDVRASGETRRQDIMHVARKLFADRGYAATTMDDVAEAVKFSKPIVYQSFPSKESLYHEIVVATAQQLLASLSEATQTEDPRDKVESAFRVYFKLVTEETDAYRILFLHSHEGERAVELRNVELSLISFIEPQLAAGITDEHRRLLAAAVVGMAEGAAVSWLVRQEAQGWPTHGGDEAARLAARIATLAWGGLRAVHGD
jgi:AcrR family transcriptional regulator